MHTPVCYIRKPVFQILLGYHPAGEAVKGHCCEAYQRQKW